MSGTTAVEEGWALIEQVRSQNRRAPQRPPDPGVETAILRGLPRRYADLALKECREQVLAESNMIQHAPARYPFGYGGVIRRAVATRADLRATLAVLESPGEEYVPPDPADVEDEAARCIVSAALDPRDAEALAGLEGLATARIDGLRARLEDEAGRRADAYDACRNWPGLAAFRYACRVREEAMRDLSSEVTEFIDGLEAFRAAVAVASSAVMNRAIELIRDAGGASRLAAGLAESRLVARPGPPPPPELAEIDRKLDAIGPPPPGELDGPLAMTLATRRSVLSDEYECKREQHRHQVRAWADVTIGRAAGGDPGACRQLIITAREYPDAFPDGFADRLAAAPRDAVLADPAATKALAALIL